MLEPKQNPGFSIPFEANPKSARVRASRRITECMVERFAKPIPLFSMVYKNILIDCSRILSSFGNSDVKSVVAPFQHILYYYVVLIFMSTKYRKAGGVLQINCSAFDPSIHLAA